MFKWLFYNWYNTTDLPHINAKINIWSYVNIKNFKIKLQNKITYLILSLNNIYIKELKIFYKNSSFELIYYKLIYIIILLILLLLLF